MRLPFGFQSCVNAEYMRKGLDRKHPPSGGFERLHIEVHCRDRSRYQSNKSEAKMVFGLGHHHQQEEAAYNSFYQGNEGQEFEGSKIHEGIAGAAAFYAMKKFEERRAAEGIQDHAFAREILATVAAAEAEKFAERKGLSWEEKERAKRAATERAHSMYENYYMQ